MASRQIRRVIVLTIGWLLVALGVVGLALPFLQGVLLILLGLYVLSRESAWARLLFQKLRVRYPRLDEKIRVWRRKLRFFRRDSEPE